MGASRLPYLTDLVYPSMENAKEEISKYTSVAKNLFPSAAARTPLWRIPLETKNWKPDSNTKNMEIYIYLPLWEMESSLRDHQQDEASHSKFFCRKNKGWWEGKWVSVTVHWGSEGSSIPGTGDKRWKSNTHLKDVVENTPDQPPKTRTTCYHKLERHLWERT